ncbi:MAG: sulfatase [Planctomycetota bacterium]|nr:sulfatase [Planctomycetota bacterium]MDP6838399.1 sulfatase [Planctomycetota bacterium]
MLRPHRARQLGSTAPFRSGPGQRRRAPAAGCLLLLALLAACAPEPPRLPPDTPVIMVVVDTLRADRLSCYGCELPTSPNIDALAAQSTLFSANATQANSTFPALTSILTGLYPRTHRNFFPVPIEGTATVGRAGACLAERFQKRGYFTLAVTSHPNFADADRDAAMFHGWDRLSHISGEVPVTERPLLAHAAHTNERLFPLLDEYAARGGDQPLFLWAHYFDPHVDIFPLVYNAPPATRDLYLAQHLEREGAASYFEPLAALDPSERPEWINNHVPEELRRNVSLANGRALYDAEITSCDAGLGLLFTRLKELDLFERALILFLADHGENMGRARTGGRGNDGRGDLAFTHKRLFEGVSHTPLLLKMPGQREPVACDALTQNIDLAPTLMELFDLPALPEVEGTSLLPLIMDPAGAVHELVFTESSDVKEKSVKDLKYKYIDDAEGGASELYDLAADPGEFQNLVGAEEPAVGESLRRALGEFRPVDSMRIRLTPATEPVALELELEFLAGELRSAHGTPAAEISEDRRKLRWSVPATASGAELLLFPDQRRRALAWSVAIDGRAPEPGRVWLGKIPVEQTCARPIYWRGDKLLAEGDEAPRLRLENDPDAGALGLEMRPAGKQTMEVEVSRRRPQYGATFQLLLAEEFGPLAMGRLSHTIEATSSLPATALLDLGRAAPGDLWWLFRFDGRWPHPREVVVDSAWASTAALTFAFPHPMDHRLAGALVTGFQGERVPPGSLAIWWESGGGGAEIDTSGLDPGLEEQLRAIGYLR